MLRDAGIITVCATQWGHSEQQDSIISATASRAETVVTVVAVAMHHYSADTDDAGKAVADR